MQYVRRGALTRESHHQERAVWEVIGVESLSGTFGISPVITLLQDLSGIQLAVYSLILLGKGGWTLKLTICLCVMPDCSPVMFTILFFLSAKPV
jgi:hypothetical protein